MVYFGLYCSYFETSVIVIDKLFCDGVNLHGMSYLTWLNLHRMSSHTVLYPLMYYSLS